MPNREPAHSRASGNPASGSPPSLGRAGTIGVTAATVFFGAALLPLSLGAAGAAEPDLAFGAFQQGHYLTAFSIATNRVELKKDPKSMTLLGELYAGGLGVPVVRALNTVQVGMGFEAGFVIVLLAIILDRISRPPERSGGGSGS